MEEFSPPTNSNLNSLNCSIIDKRGFLWFGTNSGLMRYDGSSIRYYQYDPNDSLSVGGTIITDISIFGDSLLLSFRGDGVDLFDPLLERFSHFRAGASGLLPSNFVKNLLVDSNRKIWMTFQQNSDLYAYEIIDGALINTEKVELENNGIYHAQFFKDGILIGTNGNGIIYYEPSKNASTNFNRKNSGIESDIVYKMAVLNDSIVWIATVGSIEKLVFKEGQAVSKVSIEPEFSDHWPVVNAMTFDPSISDFMWFATQGSGLYRLDLTTNQYLKAYSYLSIMKGDALIQSLMFDNSNVLWIGSENNGAFKINTRNSQFNDWPNLKLYDKYVGNNGVNCIYEDKQGILYAAIETSGLVALDFQNNRAINFTLHSENVEQTLRNSIKSIVESKDGSLWLGTNGNGIFRIPNRNFLSDIRKVEVPGLGSSLIRHMVMENQNLWIGTRDFLIRYNIENKTGKTYTENNGLCSTRIRNLYLDNNRNLWIGTDEGLTVLNLDTEKTKSFNHDAHDNKTLTNDLIRSVLVDSSNRLWVGTRGGLNLFNATDSTFSNYPVFLNYGVNSFFGISEQDHYLWLNTDNGILRFNPENLQILQFTTEDGLHTNSYEANNFWQSSTGKLFYGGSNGINTFYPRNVVRNEHIPPVYITGVYINQTLLDYYPTDITKSIKLNYTDKNLRFVFSSLDYSQPSKNQYKFMLENYDTEWIYAVDDNTAKYTNLSPGEYTFRVMGSNNHGIWNNTGDIIKIIITPPWWNTPLVRFGFVGFLILLFIGIQYLLSVRKTKTNKRLEAIVEEKTQKLLQANQELAGLNKEIQSQNEELVSNVEEISAQRDDIEQQHLTLLRLKRALDKVNKQLRKANNTLEYKVKERTSHLQKANAELDRFVYSASHDLSAPLKSIRGLLHLDRIDPENNHHNYYRLISESIDKLEAVIQSLLQFSRNTNKAQVLETFVIRQFLDDIVADLKFLQPERNLVITIKGPENLTFHADNYRLRLVVSNLISNAMKYIDPDKAENKVEVEYGEADNQYLITISDNGIGIEQDQVNRIFEMFYRATDKSTGSGLGLYIAREAMSKMNGTIGATSTAGIGSTFSVAIPKNFHKNK